MPAWIMIGSGCIVVVLGVLALNGRGPVVATRSAQAGWGRIAMGGGFVLDGGTKLLGFPSGVALVVSAVALVIVVLGAVLQIQGGAFTKARRASDGD